MSEPLVKDVSELSLDVVIPVLNEAHVLERSVETVRAFLADSFRGSWRIVIVDNGSTDGTAEVAKKLVGLYPNVQLHRLLQKGRGRALRHAWLRSNSDIVCYMDVDLSTGLEHIHELVRAIAIDGYDVAIGSRLMRASRTTRSLKREVISRIYNILVKAILFTRFSDAQCGFKALSRKAVKEIVPQVKDQSWFFDTELLVLAEKQGYRVKDVPVLWVEDDDSRVKIVKTGWDDIKGLVRLRRLLWSQSFGASATASTIPSGESSLQGKRVPANADLARTIAEQELDRSA